MMLASHALIHAGVPINRVLKRVRQTREGRYRTLRGFFHGPSDHEELAYGADEPRLLTVSLGERAYGIGRSLGEVDLGALGVEVTGIRRHASRMLEPTAESVFEAGDVVVLLGPPAALARAEERLLKG